MIEISIYKCDAYIYLQVKHMTKYAVWCGSTEERFSNRNNFVERIKILSKHSPKVLIGIRCIDERWCGNGFVMRAHIDSPAYRKYFLEE